MTEIYLARDNDGELCAFIDEPYVEEGVWDIGIIGGTVELDADDFPEVTFENSPVRAVINCEFGDCIEAADITLAE